MFKDTKLKGIKCRFIKSWYMQYLLFVKEFVNYKAFSLWKTKPN